MVKVHMYTCSACKKPQGCINFYIAKKGDNEEPKLHAISLFSSPCPFGNSARWTKLTDKLENKDIPEMMRRLLYAFDGGNIHDFDNKPVPQTTDRFTDLVD